MKPNSVSDPVRRLLRGAAVLPAVTLLAVATPAAAAPPAGWEEPDNGSALEVLLILGAIPLALFIGIWVLAALPSIIKGQKYSSELAFREPEWFGGPRQGADAVVPSSSPQQGRGGASADW